MRLETEASAQQFDNVDDCEKWGMRTFSKFEQQALYVSNPSIINSTINYIAFVRPHHVRDSEILSMITCLKIKNLVPTPQSQGLDFSELLLNFSLLLPHSLRFDSFKICGMELNVQDINESNCSFIK